MQKLFIEKTKSSPEIDFNPETHILKITGESYPENTTEFYKPMMEWISEYLKEEHDAAINVIVELIYFNSSSSKMLLDLFDMLGESDKENIVVSWVHDEEDEAMQEYGEEFQEDVENLTFNIVVKN